MSRPINVLSSHSASERSKYTSSTPGRIICSRYCRSPVHTKAVQRPCGLITASDFNDQFRNLAEPFLIVGEIENGIRRLLHGKFSTEELDQAKFPGDERTIETIADLTIGECIHLIQSQQNWQKLNVPLDRAEFVKQLDRVRAIRNDVMHFDPDGLEESDLNLLRGFAGLMTTLREYDVV